MIVKSLTPARGELSGKEFLLPVRVYYEDTDAEGIVYYANYLKFAERCRSEFLRFLGGHQQEDLQSEDRVGWVVRHCEIDYLKSAVLDDDLIVSCQVVKVGHASIVIHQEIRRESEILATVDLKAVYLSIKDKKPLKIMPEMVKKLMVC